MLRLLLWECELRLSSKLNSDFICLYYKHTTTGALNESDILNSKNKSDHSAKHNMLITAGLHHSSPVQTQWAKSSSHLSAYRGGSRWGRGGNWRRRRKRKRMEEEDALLWSGSCTRLVSVNFCHPQSIFGAATFARQTTRILVFTDPWIKQAVSQAVVADCRGPAL